MTLHILVLNAIQVVSDPKSMLTPADNVADAHVLAIENLLSSKSAAGQVIHITNDQPVTFRDFMLAVWAQFDHVPSTTIRIPGSLAYVMGFLSECKGLLSGRPGALSRGSVQDGILTRYASQKKAKEILGYRPRVPLWDAVAISCRVSSNLT
jgi:sterol-4alpha-carboxylate 3-dehydrogenase (decarboxylating)